VSRFVLDASVVLTWCFPDENAVLAERVAHRFQQGDSAIAPSFWPHEVLNALLVGEKRRRISRALVQTFLAELALLPVELKNSRSNAVFERVEQLAREHGLTAYDAAYLDLAQANAIPMATLDDDLIRACNKVGVALT
jgi:predicted nucleic acid-binding protein